MQLISLNIWGGHIKEPLLTFLEKHQDVDVFCFQEVYHQATQKVSTDDRTVYLDILSEIQQVLPSHRSLFKPVVNGVYGIGIFISSRMTLLDEGELPIYEPLSYSGAGPAHRRNLQWIKCAFGGSIYTIINVHGLWNGQGKGDSPERLLQSEKICTFLDTLKTPVILMGDFNLTPKTKSLQMIEKRLHNLIRSHNITSTRSSYYPKETRFADYAMVTPKLKFKQFRVLPDEVSDHLPLYLQI